MPCLQSNERITAISTTTTTALALTGTYLPTCLPPFPPPPSVSLPVPLPPRYAFQYELLSEEDGLGDSTIEGYVVIQTSI
uniref:Uncharacterized protein n=1 Tax=Physcomitrium patens TaxID=3218 RepID=A0A2K1JMV1_PHYPA|nr:hypothetical protein PHYPA_017705 [Physcomitrium patens]